MSNVKSIEPKKKYHAILLRVNETELKQFREAKLIGLSARQVIELMTMTSCSDTDVVIIKKSNKNQFVLKRGFLRRNQDKFSKKYLYQ